MADIEVSTATDAIAVVRLNRPTRGNSVTPEVTEQMRAVFDDLMQDDGVRAVVLTGTGRVFCAGADVKAQWEMFCEQGLQAVVEYLIDPWMPSVQRAIRAIRSSPKPIVAAVNGAASAGGCDFALACDRRIAATTARFNEAYITLGMVPVGGGSHLLSVMAGRSTATDMVLSAIALDAEQSLAAGLVDEVVDSGELIDRAMEVATRLAAGPTASVREAKALLCAEQEVAWEAALVASYAANCRLLWEPEVQERLEGVLRTFGERPPR